MARQTRSRVESDSEPENKASLCGQEGQPSAHETHERDPHVTGSPNFKQWVEKTSSSEPDNSKDESYSTIKLPASRRRGRPPRSKTAREDQSPKCLRSAKRNRISKEERSEPTCEAEPPRAIDAPEDHEDFSALHRKIGEEYHTTKRGLEEAQAEILNLRAQLTDAQGKLTVTDVQVSDTLTKLATTQSKLAAIQREMQQQKIVRLRKEQELRAEIQRLEDRSAVLSHRLVQESEANKNRGKYQKKCDGEIVSLWGEMVFNIQILAGGLDGLVALKSVPEQSPKNDDSFASLVRRCHAKPHAANFFHEQSIWRYIFSMVFRATSKIWGGDFGQTLSRFILDMQDRGIHEPKYMDLASQIKSRIVEDVDDKLQLDEPAFQSFLDGFTSRVAKFSRGSNGSIGIRKRLDVICRQAFELHTIMMKSKAIFRIGWEVTGDPANNDRFEVFLWEHRLSEPTTIIELVSPCLEKIGTADGYQFDKRTILCPGRAIAVEEKAQDEEDSSEETSSKEQSMGEQEVCHEDDAIEILSSDEHTIGDENADLDGLFSEEENDL